MQWLEKIFDVFSKRPRPTEDPIVEIPESFRKRILMWSAEVFSNKQYRGYGSNHIDEFWAEIHRILKYRHAEFQLTEGYVESPGEDCLPFLITCQTDYFLDFLEDIFRVDCLFHVPKPENDMVKEINYFFELDKLSYFLTDYITERVKSKHLGPASETIQVVSYPRVACRGNQIAYTQALVPALELLQRTYFRSANNEFLEALEHYRKGEYEDCLTKCGSTFESVLKVLCDRKGWPYRQNDTASTLVKTFLNYTSLENYFEPLLMILPTLRNKLSSAHGAGTTTNNVPQHRAQYAINCTASAILLLVYEAGEK